MAADPSAVRAVLIEAQRFGFLGPAPVDEQYEHAAGLAELLERAGVGPAGFLDLGSGGGLPGLVLAARWPDVPATLLDASTRRTDFLVGAVTRLGWAERVRVLRGRGEDLARRAAERGAFALVVARSFGPPAVTAEIGSGFVAPGGVLAVSEPVGDATADARWPTDGVATLGLGSPTLMVGPGSRLVVLRRVAALDDRWPRANGMPAKRPLWTVEAASG